MLKLALGLPRFNKAYTKADARSKVCFSSRQIDTETGRRLYHLKPRCKDEEGNRRQCNCGSFYDEDNGIQEVQTMLYTRIAPLRCVCYNVKCLKKECEISYTEAAEEVSFSIQRKQQCQMKLAGLSLDQSRT